jgi:hypothetical protein
MLERLKILIRSKVFWLEIVATITLLIGVLLNSFNVYPENLFVNIVSGVMWTVLVVIWRKWSLLIIEVVVGMIYIAGALKWMGVI